MNSWVQMSRVMRGHDVTIGDAFWANRFDEQVFDGLIDPVVMLDHFRMTQPTFAPHPHAGISAVTYMFEDAVGAHVNYDSMGNHGPIHPGALHWFAAGRGAVHTEQPEGEGNLIHALQIFVNLPASKKYDAPYAVHAEPHEIPEVTASGVRVRVVLGRSNGVSATHSVALPEPFTLLDGFLDTDSAFGHEISAGWSGLIYLLSGTLCVHAGLDTRELRAGDAIGVAVDRRATERGAEVRFVADKASHFVVLLGPTLNEPLAKHGPFVMNSRGQLEDRIKAYQSGEFGQLVMPQTGA
ncbi:pirin family protein [Paraburkholderia dipogonis]|uniref:Pirin family protein n=1 Tax=Paraburkholderia dipogonis TaxID=1211383 RepID=A0A4Y8MRN0_9BURK|nr:pirin family protein [Paraburkholderia dipogonis]TFE40101.1 pirin family protein [Paraburkholderia dipogonis]